MEARQLSGSVFLGILLLAANQASAFQGSPAGVSGTVTYRQRIALPPNAEITVKLVDVSRQDVAATELAIHTIVSGGNQVPFPFTLTYDPAAIDQRNTYAVQAQIRVDGQLTFMSMQQYPVITRGNPTTVEVVVEPVSGGTPSEGGGTPSQLPDTGYGSGAMLLLVALAITSMLVGISLRRRGYEW